MVTRLSSKGQVVIPRAARMKLRLAEGATLECRIEGSSIRLTPTRSSGRANRLVRDKKTGLVVTTARQRGHAVTTQDVRNALSDFP